MNAREARAMVSFIKELFADKRLTLFEKAFVLLFLLWTWEDLKKAFKEPKLRVVK